MSVKINRKLRIGFITRLKYIKIINIFEKTEPRARNGSPYRVNITTTLAAAANY